MGAIAYNWILPPGAFGSSNTNEIYVSYGGAVSGTVGVSITDYCGTGNISSVAVNVSVSGRQAILQVANTASLTDHELTMRDRLRDTLGYTVLFKQYNSAIGAELACTDVIIISGDVNDVNNAFRTATQPIVAMTYVRDMMSAWVYKELEMCDDAGGADNYTPSNKPVMINIVNNTHPVTYGFVPGDVAVMVPSNNSYLTWITPLASGQTLARMKYGSHAGDGAVVVYESGALMDDGFNTPARRVAIPFSHFNGGGWDLPAPDFNTELTAMGRKLFDQAVCWAANNCTNCPSSLITSSAVTHVACAGQSSGIIDITVSTGTAPFNYIWSNGRSTQDINMLTSGSYLVTVTDKNNCRTVGGYVVSQPVALSVSIAVTSVSCRSLTDGNAAAIVYGGTSPYSYQWSTGVNLQNLSNTATGTYFLSVTDGKNCFSGASVMITEPVALSVLSFVTHVSVFAGSDGIAAVSATGGTAPYLYSWSNGASSQSISNMPSGVYTVTVTDGRGCSAVSTVSIIEPGVINITSDVSHVSCYGNTDGAIYLTVSGGVTPYLFEWSNGVIGKDITTLTQGTYTITVTDNNSAVLISSFVVSEPALLTVQSASITHCTCNGYSNAAIDITISGGKTPYAFIWNNGRVTGDIVALTTGAYKLTITDASGCISGFSATVTQPAGISVVPVITSVSEPGF